MVSIRMVQRSNHFLLGSILVMAAFVSPVNSGEINSRAGTSAFPFLKINVGARPVAMGGAFTGLADDETALYYNPAGIATLESDRDRYILGYHNYFVDLQSGFVGYMHRLSESRMIAFHASYLNFGDFTQTDRAGNITGSFGGGDLLLATSFAFRKSHLLAFGATVKFIYEKIQNFSATGAAVDLGVRYNSDRGRYTAGLMLQNAGVQLSELGDGGADGLPATLRAGASARPRGLPLILVADVIVPFDNDVDLAVGAEYIKLQPLYLRLGWNSFGSNFRRENGDNGLAGLSLGIGLEHKSMHISYSFTPAADLGESHRITLTGGI